MANTKSKTTKQTTKKDVKKEQVTSERDEQIKELQKQVDEQKQQINELLSVLQQTSLQQTSLGFRADSVNNNDDIRADEEILIVSLMPNRLNLVGDGGVVFLTFNEMYEEQYIDYATLKEIVRTNRQMAKNGRFYIVDEKVVNKLRLKNDYKNILTPDQLKTLVSQDVNKAISLYELANSRQKSIIVEMVKQSKFDGKEVDYNLLKRLEELSGVELVDVEDVTKIDK